MALIECPECGKTISDKAIKCVNCGHEFVAPAEEEEPKSPDPVAPTVRTCNECGASLYDENAETCPICGCPVELTEEEKKEKQEKDAKAKKQRTKIIAAGAAAAVVLIVLVGFLAISTFNHNKEIKEYNAYVSAFNTAVDDMLDGAASAESITNMTKRVWYSAIYDDYYEWDTDIQNYYSNDFNTAIENMYDDTTIETKVTLLKLNQDTVKSDMAKVQGAPDDFDNAYVTINEMYDTYLEFTGYAVSPSGNYTTFASQVNQLDKDFITDLNKVRTQIPSSK